MEREVRIFGYYGRHQGDTTVYSHRNQFFAPQRFSFFREEKIDQTEENDNTDNDGPDHFIIKKEV